MPDARTIDEVRQYWDAHPLFSHEIRTENTSREFFQEMDRIKLEDVERFSMGFWDFPGHASGVKLLDIGCGPGFLTRHFAALGFDVTAVDLSGRAVALTRKSLELYSLAARVEQGNAENLEFPDGSFDYVVSSGCLHHTPDTQRSVAQACRVLKPGGRAKITLYYKNILLRRPVWYLTRSVYKAIAPNVPGRAGLPEARTPDDFIRSYDGDLNPVGKAYSIGEARQLLSGPFTWVDAQVHYFPVRFMPRWLPLNTAAHRFLDAHFGTMVYVNLVKADNG